MGKIGEEVWGWIKLAQNRVRCGYL